MKTQILFTFSPPCFSSLMPFSCQGLKIRASRLGWGSVVIISGLFFFPFFFLLRPVKYFLAEKMDVSFKKKKKLEGGWGESDMVQ